ncbi:phospholipid/cholesterol/gamma-HCH transport system permease protein [Algoriphagus alkaliphilus]|uniref:Phospholipid/cholesterol/gamma-HCH transport system permease protein n=1 Tax=Algoriphagus alkaliphilus TaxID=279824 RepID=A0A1G5YI35_9BACT|nr:ABC transporter permease [Algoriphagus alkaliphilus]MBA4301171.1 ABC transporter permease [Cyclobacterium sp.]SDA81986.1 phospholipid/cholesterol/gamma-HCH transport system permease protein [Algoriphagus alkaliphilus]
MAEEPDDRKPLLSKKIDKFFTGLADAWNFVKRFFQEVLFPPYEFKEVIHQCYRIGVESLPLISLTGFIVGVVFTNQSRPSLSEFGAASWLPSLISIAVVRAMGPLVTALIAAGKVGSSIGAEIGSMKVTEQIDAMEVSATNPFKFLVVTRVLATTFMIPLLVMYTDFVALMGSFLSVNKNELVSMSTFFVQVFESLTFLDITSSIFKSILFGFTIGIVGCYKGYNSSKGTEGVGRAANAAVVMAMFLIFIEELLVLQIVNAIRGS